MKATSAPAPRLGATCVFACQRTPAASLARAAAAKCFHRLCFQADRSAWSRPRFLQGYSEEIIAALSLALQMRTSGCKNPTQPARLGQVMQSCGCFPGWLLSREPNSISQEMPTQVLPLPPEAWSHTFCSLGERRGFEQRNPMQVCQWNSAAQGCFLVHKHKLLGGEGLKSHSLPCYLRLATFPFHLEEIPLEVRLWTSVTWGTPGASPPALIATGVYAK